MKKGQYKYASYKDVISNTVPGRCYSIAELLQRVLRGQPLPQVGVYDEEKEIPSDSQINAQIDAVASHPMSDKDADEIEAYIAKSDIDEHIDMASKKSNFKN